MGFFTRKDPADQAQSSKRAAVPSEVQAAELRGRARRRLAGAVALVLAAVIILPMVLDSQPKPVDDNIPIRVPERNTPFQPQVTEPQVAAPQTPTPGGAAPTDPSAIPTPPPVTSVQPPATATPTTPPATQPATPPVTAAVTPPKPEPKPATPPKSEPKPATPAKPDTRSDDGARALALLEGRPAPAATAPAPKPAAKGNFVLQIAAYTTSEDAQSRRGKLHQAGVTNAFVEQATVNGKQQYRLRVGPFPSREAAQAAQARLRTLGYDNGFIAAQ